RLALCCAAALRRSRSIRPRRGLGGADLAQQGGRQLADLGHEPLQLFARERRHADVDPLGIGEQFGVLHGGVERAPQRGQAIGGGGGGGGKGAPGRGRRSRRRGER